ncbi:hypothetical protein [Actinokineospora spheciospongiae]|uniref:hypothetical protein n=1 Tax=Actinokineospora spheciospongiae TaxID=909613 RepID=UPI000D70B7D9|nr:hypothetical protein [Actinokineospora spheciospongiae]PWW67038.1 hypothetical protein DFQ13_101556 [Actinokineospora spheciospongiae]
MLKLDASGSEWIAADRAMRAASTSSDPLLLAEAHRMLGSVFRRAAQADSRRAAQHHDRAQALTLAAAEHLDINTRNPKQDHLALHGLLMCSAGYAAARAGDRDRTTTFLHEAQITVDRLAPGTTAHQQLAANVLSHQVSAHYLLGDAGTALHHARAASALTFPDTERHARYLGDVALCFAQWGKPARAHTLLHVIERLAPDEVRTRTTMRRLIGELLDKPGDAPQRDLQALATRAGIRR